MGTKFQDCDLVPLRTPKDKEIDYSDLKARRKEALKWLVATVKESRN
jgi:hypothetical protein